MAIKARKMAAKASKMPARALKIVAKAPPPPPLKHGVIMDERGHRVLRGYAKKDDVPKSVRDSLQLGTYLETDDGGCYELGLSKSNGKFFRTWLTRCRHHRWQPRCPDCYGRFTCRHGVGGRQILKLACIICNPCKHKKRMRSCLMCKFEGIPGGGANLCDSHGKQSYSCKRCTRDLHALGYATLYCFHLVKRDDCGPCKGRRICSTPDCFLRVLGNGCDLCLACFVIANPKHTLTVKWRRKELAVVEYFKRVCPRLKFISNKQVPNGSSNRRPDMFFDLGSFALIVEVDETQHRGSSYVDEHARILDLYGDMNGDRSSWSGSTRTGTSTPTATASSRAGLRPRPCSWTRPPGARLRVLVQTVLRLIRAGKPKHAITIVKLFYNGYSTADPALDTFSLDPAEVDGELDFDETTWSTRASAIRRGRARR